MTIVPRGAAAAALCTVCITLTTGGQALADDGFEYKIGGFGTVGGVVTDLNGTQFRTGLDQHKGADKHIDLGVDSRLGLQTSVIYNTDFTLTAQLVGTRRDDVDFDLGFDWLYLQYTGVPGLDVKVGRMALPAFLVSDSRYVGYSTPWLRVPPLVYSLMPVVSVDGAQAGYRHAIGPVTATVQLTYGRDQSNFLLVRDLSAYGQGFAPVTIDTLTRSIDSVNLTFEWKDWTARVGKINSGVNQPSINSSFKDDFTGVGLQYDNGKLLTMFEYVQRQTDPTRYDASAWYAGAGYRIRWFMPYAVVSGYKMDSGLPGHGSHGLALGLRYDFATNLALKTEWARYDTHDELIFTDAVSPGVAGKHVDVLSVSLDFVF